MCNKTEIHNIEISHIEVFYIIGKHLFDYKPVYSVDHLVPYTTYLDTTTSIDQEHWSLLSIS